MLTSGDTVVRFCKISLKFVLGFTMSSEKHTVKRLKGRSRKRSRSEPVQLDLVFRAPPVCQALHWGPGPSGDKEQPLQSPCLVVDRGGKLSGEMQSDCSNEG